MVTLARKMVNKQKGESSHVTVAIRTTESSLSNDELLLNRDIIALHLALCLSIGSCALHLHVLDACPRS